MENNYLGKFINTLTNKNIFYNYKKLSISLILQIQYSSKTLNQWSSNTVADGWIIATAMTKCRL
ncbi:MAG: hypothetical protein LBU12_08535 [Deltaproteobacteria bacterium]|nr:hypothetical protein [Deltaproteobacteria bacterium]